MLAEIGAENYDFLMSEIEDDIPTLESKLGELKGQEMLSEALEEQLMRADSALAQYNEFEEDESAIDTQSN